MVKQPKDVERHQELMSYDINDLREMARSELGKAKSREMRLSAATGGDTSKLSYSARTAAGIISPFTTKSGHISTKVTGFDKGTLINAIMRAETYNAAATTIAANANALTQEERAYGMTQEELERRKSLWDIASRSGIMDFFESSDQEAETDVYSMILRAEDEEMTDDEFEAYLTEQMSGYIE